MFGSMLLRNPLAKRIVNAQPYFLQNPIKSFQPRFFSNLKNRAPKQKVRDSNYTTTEYQKLVFDHESKALIYNHHNGDRQLGWIFRSCVAACALFGWLFFMEIREPLFGTSSKLTFGLITSICGTV